MAVNAIRKSIPKLYFWRYRQDRNRRKEVGPTDAVVTGRVLAVTAYRQREARNRHGSEEVGQELNSRG